MAFKENRDGKFIYKCDTCGIEFQFGPHIYKGVPGPNDTMHCRGCGTDPFQGPTLTVKDPPFRR